MAWAPQRSEKMRLDVNGNLMLGVTTASAKLHAVATTEQLRIGYDTSNYYSTTVSSTGGVTFNAVGSGAGFTFSDNISASNLSGTNTGDQDLSSYATTAAVAAGYQPLATVLTNTTASFTTAKDTKLSGIETGAQVNTVTASNAVAFTNKTGNISQWTNDSGYLTSLAGAVTSVSGTTNRITSSGGATPVIDISASYVGQSSITTLGTVTTGVWNGTAIGDTYISSAATWNAKQSAITFGTGVQTALGINTGSSGGIVTTDSNPTFSGGRISAAAPTLTIYQTDAAADTKRWDIESTGSTGAFFIRTRDDAGAGGTVAFTILRNNSADVTGMNFTTNSGTFAFSGGDVTVPDEAYGAGWNSSLEVPTKNAVYDEMETRIKGGSISLTSNFTTSSLSAVSTNLSFPIAANEVFTVTIEGSASKATTNTGMKLAIAAPTGCTISGEAYLGAATLAALPVPSLLTAINTLGNTFATGIGVRVTFRQTFTVVNGANAGNITLQGATVTSNVATIFAGTRMTYRKGTQV
jgi:hypothetical protein